MLALSIMSWSFPVALGWGLISIVYWHVGRQVFHDAINFRIFAKRDRLRRLAIDESVNPDSFSYDFLEKRLCQTAFASPHITVQNFMRFMLCDESKRPAPELERFLEEAPPEMKELWDEAMKNVFLMMLVNSPILSMLAGLAAILGPSTVSREVPVFFENRVVESPQLHPLSCSA